MAAGLTIKKTDLDLFRLEFNTIAKKLITADQLNKTLTTDGHLDEKISLEEVELIQLKVWGQDFEAPVFVDTFKITDQISLKNNHKKLKMINTLNSRNFEGIIFREPRALPDIITAVYQLNVNTYRNSRSLQLIINHWIPCDPD